jgi:hypothetical protein
MSAKRRIAADRYAHIGDTADGYANGVDRLASKMNSLRLRFSHQAICYVAMIDQEGVRFNPGPSWKVTGAGDFNGDGDSDILWQNTNGQAGIWEMNGTNVISTAAVGSNPGPSWKVVGTGDFNGDGYGDILWRDTSGDLAVWLMNGATVIASGGLGTIPTTLTVAGTGDSSLRPTKPVVAKIAPVTLPPGLVRLATSPSRTGS